jgi:DNA modification methylase
MLRISKNQVIFGGNYFSNYLPPSKCFYVWDKKQSEKFSSAMCEFAWCSKTSPAKLYRRHAASFEKFHPTTKPVDLMEWVLGWFPDVKSVIDPFMGSGTTGVACVNTGRKFIGIEKDETYFGVAWLRIEQARLK